MNILEVENLTKHYAIKRGLRKKVTVKALDGISFDLKKGETIGIVGESGCGKSTLARQLVGLETPTAGTINFHQDESDESQVQMIFQDPYSSINPRKKAWKIVAEPLIINSSLGKEEIKNRAYQALKQVGIRPELANRYPHMFSGGQRQRLGIARALITKPSVIICDEPVSALDVSVQAQVLNLLIDLQDQHNLTYIFIGHDLHVVNHMSHQLMVMYLGKVVEYGDREKVFNEPKHPYTKALMASSPSILKNANKEPAVSGELPSPLNPPKGCAFSSRCPLATDKCLTKKPPLQEKEGRYIACFEV